MLLIIIAANTQFLTKYLHQWFYFHFSQRKLELGTLHYFIALMINTNS